MIIFYIKSDLFRYTGKFSWFLLIKNLLFNKGFRYSFYYRIGFSLSRNKILNIIYGSFYKLVSNRYTIEIPLKTKIGHGLYISHPFAIAVNKNVVIGNNVNISQSVTIGKKHSGGKAGSPIIGNNVYLGPNSTLIGKILINDGAVIGANSLVLTDVGGNETVAGIPAKKISEKGSKELISNIYELS